MKKIAASFALIVLAACQPVEDEPIEQIATLTPDQTVFEEREPDLCHAADYTSTLGQPAAILQTLSFTKQYRVVAYRGIEAQEYNGQRITFRLDPNGNISNVDCG